MLVFYTSFFFTRFSASFIVFWDYYSSIHQQSTCCESSLKISKRIRMCPPLLPPPSHHTKSVKFCDFPELYLYSFFDKSLSNLAILLFFKLSFRGVNRFSLTDPWQKFKKRWRVYYSGDHIGVNTWNMSGMFIVM